MSVLLKDQWVYVFGPFVLDPARRVLARGDAPLSLSTKAFDLLLYLLENPDRVVGKDELFETIWPGKIVEESNLSQTVFTLRKTLGAIESGESVVVTAQGRGYRIGVPVSTRVRGARTEESQKLPRLQELDAANAPESTPLASRSRRSRWLAATAVLAVAIVAGGAIAIIYRARQTPRAEAQHFIVLADFDNTTGDAEFDGVMNRVLEIDLNQSPFVSLLSERKTQETLQQMGRDKDAKVTASVAQDVCERTASQAIVSGALAAVGSRYVVTLRAVDCSTGDSVAQAKADVATKEAVVESLDELTARIRTGIGESHASIRQFSVPIAQATTPSFEALKSFSLGLQARAKGDDQGALAFHKKAVELDPSFAMAYVELGTINRSLHEQQIGNDYLKKAYELRGRVSEHEKIRLSALYQLSQDDTAGMIQSYQQWTQIYPNDWPPWANLTNLFTDSARYSEAIAAGKHALKLMPDHGGVYFVLARAYSRSNDFANAKATCALAVAKGLDGSDIHNLLYEIAFAENDAATMAAQVAKETGQSSEYLMLSSQGSAAAAAGRIRDARTFYDRAVDQAQKAGAESAAEVAGFRLAEMDAAVNTGDLIEARKIAAETPGLEGNEFAPLVVAKTGDSEHAAALLDKLLKRNPREATIVEDDAPVTRAEIDLQEGRPQQAIAELRPALGYELRNFELPTVLAQAYLDANLPDAAAAEYRQIIAHHGVDGLSILYPLAYLGLARAEAKLGNTSASQTAYERFFGLWLNADPNLPILKRARQEYAALLREAT